MKKVQNVLLFLGIIVLGASLRLYGLNWDQSQHLHPDERFLTQVTNDTKWPSSIAEYFDTDTSPLNPHNKGYSFFVYGTFPVFFVKFVAELLGKANYTDITLVGRAMSAIIDSGTIILVFFITKKLTNNLLTPHLAAFLYVISVLPIQLSHFYAVDAYLTFFLWLSVYFLILLVQSRSTLCGVLSYSTLIGIAIALAISSKISGVLILPLFALTTFYIFIQKRFLHAAGFLIISIICMYLTIRIVSPYLFSGTTFLNLTPNPKAVANYTELKGFDSPTALFPPAIQWRNRTSYLFPLQSLVFHGLGLPLGFTAIISVLWLGFAIVKQLVSDFSSALDKNIDKILILSLLVIVFAYQGGLYTKNMRYFHAIYPALMIFTSLLVVQLYEFLKRLNRRFAQFAASILLLSFLIWPISFLSIYQRPHSRVIASEWIYAHIPAGARIGYEHWDDPLPLNLTGGRTQDRYAFTELPLYNGDTTEKWQQIKDKLQESDYIIMSSNRLWGSISRVPVLYPIASKYYRTLFDGSLGFQIIARITSLPCFPTARLCWYIIDDTNAEESFTVYDHPEVYVLKKTVLNINLLDTWIQKSVEPL